MRYGELKFGPAAIPGQLTFGEDVGVTLYDDIASRADTSNGDLGVATDGGTYDLLYYPGSFPMAASDQGRIEGGRMTITPQSGNKGTLYAVRDLGAGRAAKSIGADIRFIVATGGEAASNATYALLFSADKTRLIERMPVHITFNRSQLNIQCRGDGGSFITLGRIFGSVGNSPSTVYELRVSLDDDRMLVTFRGRTIVVQHAIFREACRYVCWEIQTTTNNTTGKPESNNHRASTRPNATVPAYAAAAPVNWGLPAILMTPTAGQLASVNSDSLRGNWDSNSGTDNNDVLVFTYQWLFDGVDIPGATSSTYQTVNDQDEGKRLSCRITATNSAGSTSATSPQTPALA